MPARQPTSAGALTIAFASQLLMSCGKGGKGTRGIPHAPLLLMTGEYFVIGNYVMKYRKASLAAMVNSKYEYKHKLAIALFHFHSPTTVEP